jgi:predicted nucleotidyltransferase
VELDLEDLTDALRRAGARFAYIFGSHADGTAKPRSDIDLAAYFGRQDVDPLTVDGVDFDRVDLVVLDGAPLELAGRVALHGKLLFEIDPAERVRWQALTRKIYLDEIPRMEQARKDFVAGARARASERG